MKECDDNQELEGLKLFCEAATDYIANGGEERYLTKVDKVLGMYALTEITQELLDTKARELYPAVSNASLVRWFYSPVIAVMNFSAIREWCPARKFEKPKIKQKPTEWAEKAWFIKFWDKCSPDLRRITIFLPYTGCRITEALELTWDRVNLKQRWAYIPETKNNESRTVNLPKIVVEALLEIPKENRHGKVFPLWADFRAVNWAIRRVCTKHKLKYLSTHKIGSHTYGTWMRRDAGLDAIGLVGTKRWKDLRSAARYSHTHASEESKKSDLLLEINPSKKRAERKKSNKIK